MIDCIVTLSSACLPLANDNPFIGIQFLQSHRTACMQFLGTYTYLRAETELTSIGKRGRYIDIYTRSIHRLCEIICCAGIV